MVVIPRVTSNSNQMAGESRCQSMMMFGSVFEIIPFLSAYTVANVGFTEMDLRMSNMAWQGAFLPMLTSPVGLGSFLINMESSRIFTFFQCSWMWIPKAINYDLAVTPHSFSILMVSHHVFVTSNGRYVGPAACYHFLVHRGQKIEESFSEFLTLHSAR